MRAASEVLHVSQPSINAQLKQLEESLGAPLFTRTTRRLILTEIQKQFIPSKMERSDRPLPADSTSRKRTESATQVSLRVPSVFLVFLGFVTVFHWITRYTTLGRHIYAVGGNPEAARRASIDVDKVRIVVFTLCSGIAACGGIVAASRLYAVDTGSGSGDVLLNAIAAAVIGGTSLFGGRGTIWSALLGALIIGSINNGMDLLSFPSSIKYVITGCVLLLAVTIDSTSRARRQRSGKG